MKYHASDIKASMNLYENRRYINFMIMVIYDHDYEYRYFYCGQFSHRSDAVILFHIHRKTICIGHVRTKHTGSAPKAAVLRDFKTYFCNQVIMVISFMS